MSVRVVSPQLDLFSAATLYLAGLTAEERAERDADNAHDDAYDRPRPRTADEELARSAWRAARGWRRSPRSSATSPRWTPRWRTTGEGARLTRSWSGAAAASSRSSWPTDCGPLRLRPARHTPGGPCALGGTRMSIGSTVTSGAHVGRVAAIARGWVWVCWHMPSGRRAPAVPWRCL